jgi:adenosylcobinamide-GDP ribazoletransferase
MSDQFDSEDIDLRPVAWWTDFALAAMFLTRLRLPLRESAGMPALKRASRMFAVVGLFVGLAGGVVYAVAIALGFASWLAASFAVGATILLPAACMKTALPTWPTDSPAAARPRRSSRSCATAASAVSARWR